MLLEWGWGHLAAPDLQKIAARGVCDGLAQPLLTQLAALGQSGACPRNIQRQLFNRFCSSVHPDRLVKDIDVEGSAITSMILPHELFNEIRLSDNSSFWDQGYPALMLTDTSFLRNPNYHRSTDTPDTLDYQRMTEVTIGVASALRFLAN